MGPALPDICQGNVLLAVGPALPDICQGNVLLAVGPALPPHLPRERSLGCRPCPPPHICQGNVLLASRRPTPTATNVPWQMWGGRAGPTAKRTFPWQMSDAYCHERSLADVGGEGRAYSQENVPLADVGGGQGLLPRERFLRAYCQENVPAPAPPPPPFPPLPPPGGGQRGGRRPPTQRAPEPRCVLGGLGGRCC